MIGSSQATLSHSLALAHFQRHSLSPSRATTTTTTTDNNNNNKRTTGNNSQCTHLATRVYWLANSVNCMIASSADQWPGQQQLIGPLCVSEQQLTMPTRIGGGRKSVRGAEVQRNRRARKPQPTEQVSFRPLVLRQEIDCAPCSGVRPADRSCNLSLIW